MIEKITENLLNLKKQFVKEYEGNSNIQEIIPKETSEKFPIKENHLKSLHTFAKKNPIYYNSYEQKFQDVQCIVYEGDINEYWLSSISHNSSHAPFSPTWICSAFIATLQAKKLGCKEIIDIGSGDGRIAYCARILDIITHSIEIDEELVNLQKTIALETNYNFNPNCADVTEFDFQSLKLKNPIFFIGGLAQMGGNVLASSIIEKISTVSQLKKNSGFVLVGTYSKKYKDSELNAGWGKLIEKNNLKSIKTILLPTAWTLKEEIDTPYIFTKF